MMHYDALHNPTLAQQGIAPGKKTQQQKAVISQAQHAAYLGSNPYEKFKEGDLEKVNIVFNRFILIFMHASSMMQLHCVV